MKGNEYQNKYGCLILKDRNSQFLKLLLKIKVLTRNENPSNLFNI
jgi:hypothetical protein